MLVNDNKLRNNLDEENNDKRSIKLKEIIFDVYKKKKNTKIIKRGDLHKFS